MTCIVFSAYVQTNKAFGWGGGFEGQEELNKKVYFCILWGVGNILKKFKRQF